MNDSNALPPYPGYSRGAYHRYYNTISKKNNEELHNIWKQNINLLIFTNIFKPPMRGFRKMMLDLGETRRFRFFCQMENSSIQS